MTPSLPIPRTRRENRTSHRTLGERVRAICADARIALSCQKDRRNNYGENAKSSRKNIPRHRAHVNRSYRPAVRTKLRIARTNKTEESYESVGAIKRDGWKTSGEVPLGLEVDRKLRRRERVGIVGASSAPSGLRQNCSSGGLSATPNGYELQSRR